jgi:Flp pilus assembly protein TadD
MVSGFGIALVFLLSALASGSYSGNSQVSLFGTMLDTGSFWFVFAGILLMCMSSIIFRNPKHAKMVLLGIILSSALVLVFQSIRLFVPEILSLGILTGKTGNLLGSWNALGLFAGFSCLMFLLVIEFFPISRIEKNILQVFILLAVLLAAVVNFPLVWILLGISSLIIFVYKVSIVSGKNADDTDKKVFPVVSFIVVIISLIFFMSGQFITSVMPQRLQVSATEISPSFGSTMLTGKGILVNHPVFGVGPNRFGEAWAMYKPPIVNAGQFWDVLFDWGSGLLPTLAVTTGGLGILAWLVFLFLFLFIGLKSVFASIKNKVNWETMAFFVLSLYLFTSSFFYSTGPVIFLLSLAFTGVFIGLANSGSSEEVSVSFLNDHRKSFFSILALILLVILSIAASFKYIERFVSVSYFRKALEATTIPVAEGSINKAISLYPNDLYLRTYSQVYLVKLDSLANKSLASSGADIKADIQTSFNQAVNGAQQAVGYNKTNYVNFQLLGSVYQAVGALGVKDAYSNAAGAYGEASKLNPLNPGLKLSIATALFLDGKIKDAKDYANAALSLKPDYLDALVFLSKIAKNEGNNALALSYAQAALKLDPTNKDLIQYADSLNTPTPSPKPITPSNSKK